MKKKFIVAVMIGTLCFSLTGCKNSDYKKAVEDQGAGQYEEAVRMYDELGNYKDSYNRKAECENMIAAIEKYSKAESAVQIKNRELDASVKKAEDLIEEKKSALDETLVTSLETVVSDTKSAKIDVLDMPKTLDDINKETQKFNAIDYTSTVDALNKSYNALDKSIKQYALVDAPKEKYIIKCLKRVAHIVDISAVTERNDPNGKLNKAGGYTAQVYFSSNQIKQSELEGKTIIEKGTDCGGSIEVYATAEDAKKRNEYLAAFDGGIFASGSHTVIGTIIVRTSDKLTASEQKKMEKEIIKSLTTVK